MQGSVCLWKFDGNELKEASGWIGDFCPNKEAHNKAHMTIIEQINDLGANSNIYHVNNISKYRQHPHLLGCS